MHELAEMPYGQLTRSNHGQKRQQDAKDASGEREMSIFSLDARFANKKSIISDAVC